MPSIITYSLQLFNEHIQSNRIYSRVLTINNVPIIVYATETGIVAATIGEKSTEIHSSLPMPDELRKKVLRGDYPLIIAGTPFQQSVWREIVRIKPGTTITYSKLAESCGNKKAVRAAASATGKNAIAYFIPCHRVIGKNGDLCGYKWGIETKKLLLEHEIKNNHTTHIALA